MSKHAKVPPWFGCNYEEHWRYINPKDKVILDLGCDSGSSMSWFFEKGAKKVIGVDGDPEKWPAILENYGNDPDAVCLKILIENSQQINELIEQYEPDLVKSDIEGAEMAFLELNIETASKVKEYIIEAHRNSECDIAKELTYFFVKLGYDTRIYDYYGSIIYALRR